MGYSNYSNTKPKLTICNSMSFCNQISSKIVNYKELTARVIFQMVFSEDNELYCLSEKKTCISIFGKARGITLRVILPVTYRKCLKWVFNYISPVIQKSVNYKAITEITGLLRDFYSRCDSRVNVSKTATAIQNNVSYAVTVSQGEWLKTVRTAKLSA